MNYDTFLKRTKILYPGISESDVEYLLWNHTSFPFGCPGAGRYKTSFGHYLNQLRRLKKAVGNGKIVCNYCGRIALASGDEIIDDICKRCDKKRLDKVQPVTLKGE